MLINKLKTPKEWIGLATQAGSHSGANTKEGLQQPQLGLSRSLIFLPLRLRLYTTRVAGAQASLSSLAIRQDRRRDHVARHRGHERCPADGSRDRRSQDRLYLHRRGVDLLVVFGVHRLDRGVRDCRHTLKSVDRARRKQGGARACVCECAREGAKDRGGYHTQGNESKLTGKRRSFGTSSHQDGRNEEPTVARHKRCTNQSRRKKQGTSSTILRARTIRPAIV